MVADIFKVIYGEQVNSTPQSRKNVARTLTNYIKNGGDVNAIGYDNKTLIWSASALGLIDCVKVLIKAKADLNISESYSNYSALMNTIGNKYPKIAMLLIKANADVNIQNKSGTTALMFAAEDGYKGLVKQLIKAKADVNATDNKGRTALTYAIKNGHNDIVNILKESGAIISKDSFKEVERLLNEGKSLYRDKKFIEAVKPLHDALELAPDSEDIMYNLALVYLELKWFEATGSIIKRIKKLDCTEIIVELRKHNIEI